MVLNIENREAEQLAAEVAALIGETETGAITVALRARRRVTDCAQTDLQLA